MTSPLLATAGTASPDGQRRSLVLAGGGMRVAYQAGVLAALEQAGLRFHHVDGSSGGTMNLSMLLCGQDSEEIGQRWRALRQRHFAALLPWRDYLSTLRWPALGGAQGVRDNVFPQLGIDPDLIRRATGVVGTYNVCNFVTKTAEVVEHPDVDLDLLVAAVSLPILMPAVVRRGTPYTDAVWIRDSNIPEAVARGSDEIWLVWCIGNTPAYHNGLFRQYVHMIEMAANGSLLRDLGYIADRWPQRPVRVHVIKPEYPLPLDPAYFTGQIDAATLIALGYQDACRYLDNPAPLSAPWQPGITQMREARRRGSTAGPGRLVHPRMSRTRRASRIRQKRRHRNHAAPAAPGTRPEQRWRTSRADRGGRRLRPGTAAAHADRERHGGPRPGRGPHATAGLA